MNQPITQQQPKPCNEVDMEELANEALSINMAVDWIVQAHSLLEEIRIVVGGYPDIGKFFQDRQIPINCADWSECEMDEHVGRILMRQFQLIKRMAGATT